MVDEEEVPASPMARMRPPIVPEAPVPVIADEDARRLIRACTGSDFVSRRDTAIIRLFFDTGQVGGSQVADLDLDCKAWPSSWGRAAGSERARSGHVPGKPSTATSGCGTVTGWQRPRPYGWASGQGR